MEKKLDLPKQKDLKVIPKDETLDAIVIDITETNWFELTKNEEKRLNLKNPKGKVLIIKYDAKGFIRSDNIPLNDSPTTQSRYGRFITKYNLNNDPEFIPYVGMQIKVLFDEKGNSEIILSK